MRGGSGQWQQSGHGRLTWQRAMSMAAIEGRGGQGETVATATAAAKMKLQWQRRDVGPSERHCQVNG